MNSSIRRLRWSFAQAGSAIPLVAYIFGSSPRWGSIIRHRHWGLLASHAGLNGLLQALRESALRAMSNWRSACSPIWRWRPFWKRSAKLFDCTADLFRRRSMVCRTPANRGLITLSAAAGVCAFLHPRICVMALGYAGVAGSAGTAHPCHAGGCQRASK